MNIKVYVGCSLTHGTKEFKRQVEIFKTALGKLPRVEVLCFLGVKENTPRGVYEHDIVECVYKCDLMVAICDEPSTGLGWEMATQIEKRQKPLLALAQKDAKITRLVQDPGLPNYEFHRYEELMGDAFDLVTAKIVALRKEMIQTQGERWPIAPTAEKNILGPGH